MKNFSLIIFCFLLMFSCSLKDAHFMTIEAHKNRDDRIQIDGHFAQVSEIKAALYFKMKDYDSIQKSLFYVKLKLSKETPMGIVSDIKQELRKANILNVKYYEVEPIKYHPM